jgi:hypothetical protein
MPTLAEAIKKGWVESVDAMCNDIAKSHAGDVAKALRKSGGATTAAGKKAAAAAKKATTAMTAQHRAMTVAVRLNALLPLLKSKESMYDRFQDVIDYLTECVPRRDDADAAWMENEQ